MGINHSILLDAINEYGKRNQLIVACEELSELQKELCKSLRGNPDTDHIAEEVADVEIMVEQIKMIFQIKESVKDWENRKIERLKTRIEMKDDSWEWEKDHHYAD